ncbi:Succinate-semialdehyde dehydrogenase [NAD] [Salmonella bongori]|nr:Succinate-semialdehyde dehydrogenase [NAD] [Salmonella bongori]
MTSHLDNERKNMTILTPTQALSIDPATGQTISTMSWSTPQEIEQALNLAANDFNTWKMLPVAQRAQKLRDIGQALRVHAEEMAQCITREMGKPIKQARAEVTKSAALCDWYAEHGPAMLNSEPTLVENQQAVIEYRPAGRHSGDNAMEFSFMAGITWGGTDTVGGELLCVEARPQCDRLRAR